MVGLRFLVPSIGVRIPVRQHEWYNGYMYIQKLGHCCLLITIDNTRILTDPGAFTVEAHKDVKDIDIILITHEHADHLHVESLGKVVANNPDATVITNSAVGNILKEKNIEHQVLEGTGTDTIKNILLEAFDARHEELFGELGQVQNTGYFIGNKLFYPGDAFCNPQKPVEILALPVAGPWCKITDAINYALALKPTHAFPVHDGMLQTDKVGGSHLWPKTVLSDNNINFVPMLSGDEHTF